MDRTDINQPFNRMAHTLSDDIFCTLHIDAVKLRRNIAADADQSCPMDNNDFCTGQTGENFFQRFRFRDVAFVIGDLAVALSVFRRKNQSADFTFCFAQILNDCPGQMSGIARIFSGFPLHKASIFRKILSGSQSHHLSCSK